MNENKTSCREVMEHICDNLGEELNSPKCIEIKVIFKIVSIAGSIFLLLNQL